MTNFLLRKKSDSNYYPTTSYGIKYHEARKLQKQANEQLKTTLHGDFALIADKSYIGKIDIHSYDICYNRVHLLVNIDGINCILYMYPYIFTKLVQNEFNWNIYHEFKLIKHGYTIHVHIIK